MTIEELTRRIKEQLVEEFYLDIPLDINVDNISIFELGINSIDFFHILDFLNLEYGIRVNDTDLSETNFTTIHQIARFVFQKQRNR